MACLYTTIFFAIVEIVLGKRSSSAQRDLHMTQGYPMSKRSCYTSTCDESIREFVTAHSKLETPYTSLTESTMTGPHKYDTVGLLAHNKGLTSSPLTCSLANVQTSTIPSLQTEYPGSSEQAIHSSQNVTSEPATMSILHNEIAATFEHSLLSPPASPNSLLFTSLLNELLSSEIATIWEQIGIILGVDNDFLETMKINHPDDCKTCFVEVLKEWMKQINPPPSWLTIISAIEKFQDYHSLTQTLRHKYLPEGEHQGAKAMNLFALGGSSVSHVHGQGLSEMPGIGRVQRHSLQGSGSAAAISLSHTSSYAADVTTSLSVPSVTPSQFLVSPVPPPKLSLNVSPSPSSNILEQNVSAEVDPRDLPVLHHFLDMIEWEDEEGSIRELRIYSRITHKWQRIATRLGFELGEIESMEENHCTNRSRVTAVFRQWFDNASNLRNARRYPKSWQGLIDLLKDSELGELAEELQRALFSPKNSVMDNI